MADKRVEISGQQLGGVGKMIDEVTSLFGSLKARADAEATKLDTETAVVSEPKYQEKLKTVMMAELDARLAEAQRRTAEANLGKKRAERQIHELSMKNKNPQQHNNQNKPDVKKEMKEGTKKVHPLKPRFSNDSLKNGLEEAAKTGAVNTPEEAEQPTVQ